MLNLEVWSSPALTSAHEPLGKVHEQTLKLFAWLPTGYPITKNSVGLGGKNFEKSRTFMFL